MSFKVETMYYQCTKCKGRVPIIGKDIKTCTCEEPEFFRTSDTGPDHVTMSRVAFEDVKLRLNSIVASKREKCRDLEWDLASEALEILKRVEAGR